MFVMGHEINIEIFVNKQLDAIQAQATSSRSKEHKELRDACQELKGMSLFKIPDQTICLFGS